MEIVALYLKGETKSKFPRSNRRICWDASLITMNCCRHSKVIYCFSIHWIKRLKHILIKHPINETILGEYLVAHQYVIQVITFSSEKQLLQIPLPSNAGSFTRHVVFWLQFCPTVKTRKRNYNSMKPKQYIILVLFPNPFQWNKSPFATKYLEAIVFHCISSRKARTTLWFLY